jgi:hypothetical protein
LERSSEGQSVRQIRPASVSRWRRRCESWRIRA